MKALLSIGYGCVLAALTPGLCRAAATDDDLPKAGSRSQYTRQWVRALLSRRKAPPPRPQPRLRARRRSERPASENVTINLINRLVQRGALSKEDADELIKQAEADAVKAREQASCGQPHGQAEQPPAPDTSPFRSTIAAPSTESLAAAAVQASLRRQTLTTRCAYPMCRRSFAGQIAEEVREEVMQQARDENWANPRTLPGWILRLTPFADFRLRYEGLFFPDGNDNTGGFPNFNAINTGAPFDTTGTTFSPQNNVDKDRNRFRIRVRFGAEMDLEDGFTFGLRIATGETSNPVSANQTFGFGQRRAGRQFQ